MSHIDKNNFNIEFFQGDFEIGFKFLIKENPKLKFLGILKWKYDKNEIKNIEKTFSVYEYNDVLKVIPLDISDKLSNLFEIEIDQNLKFNVNEGNFKLPKMKINYDYLKLSIFLKKYKLLDEGD